VPRTVETVINHRVVGKTQIVAGVSGGVMVAPADELERSRETKSKSIDARSDPPQSDVQKGQWWWDAE
jgi:hypothetical protein